MKPKSLNPMLHNKRSHCSEIPLLLQREKACKQQMKTQCSKKKKKRIVLETVSARQMLTKMMVGLVGKQSYSFNEMEFEV